MDELKNLNRTLGFYFFLNLKNLNSDFLGFLGFKKPKKPRFFKAMSNSPNGWTFHRFRQKPARGNDVICLTPAGGHIVGRHR